MTDDNNLFENNEVYIAGKISGPPMLTHEIYGEKFYCFDVNVRRLSDSFDIIPVLISERLVHIEQLVMGKLLEVEGQFRSYNSSESGKSHLILNLFAREARFIDDIESIENHNRAYFNGFICKKPNYRTTPFGREITDLLLAVNRAYKKSDYIPCICWGRNARYCESLAVGTNIRIWGRIQSRFYQKANDDGSMEKKIAYEISINRFVVNHSLKQEEI
ncbi:MAG: single-stranded DNA-binding protein [Clostridia bacterium]